MIRIEVDHRLTVENWTLFSLSWTVVLTRFACRIRTVGFKGFQGDDYCAFAVLACVLVDAVTVYISTYTGQNLSVTPEMEPTLTAADIAQLECGSQMQLIAWYNYTTFIWIMKFSMLFFYQRLTTGSFYIKLVKWAMIFTAICYVILFFVLTFGCYPFNHNWQVLPKPSWKCSFRPQNFYALTVLNTVSDAVILVIPLPMLWKLRVTWRRKLAIGIFLSSGLFLIAASIVRLCATFGASPSGDNINRWGLRETALGVFTVNLPILRPMFTKAFWKSGPYVPQFNPQNGDQKTSRSTFKGSRLEDNGMHRDDIELGNTDKQEYLVGILSHSSSRENMLDDDMNMESRVTVVKTINIRHENMDGQAPAITSTAYSRR